LIEFGQDDIAIAAAIFVVVVGLRRTILESANPLAQLEGILKVEFLALGISQAEPITDHIQIYARNERRHDDECNALANTRFQPLVAQRVPRTITTHQEVSRRNLKVAREWRCLDPWIESPTEREITV
jgi:hypothetical protein